MTRCQIAARASRRCGGVKARWAATHRLRATTCMWGLSRSTEVSRAALVASLLNIVEANERRARTRSTCQRRQRSVAHRSPRAHGPAECARRRRSDERLDATARAGSMVGTGNLRPHRGVSNSLLVRPPSPLYFGAFWIASCLLGERSFLLGGCGDSAAALCKTNKCHHAVFTPMGRWTPNLR